MLHDVGMKIQAIALLVATCSTAAFAGDLGVANRFNAFIFGSIASNGGHAQGAMAAGSNWTGSGYDSLQSALAATVGTTTNIGMYVAGSVSFTNGGSVNNSGNAYVNGNFGSSNPFNMNGGTLFYGGSLTGSVNGNKQNVGNTVDPNVFSSQQSYSQQQSAAIASLGGESINTSGNNWSINAALQSGPLKVYSLSAASLSSLATLDISNLLPTDTLVINVVGNSVGGFGVTLNSGLYNRILWNASTATAFNISDRALHGSLLAPNASIVQNQNIDGNLIASSLVVNNSVELHAGAGITFDGNVPVPEPISCSVLALGSLLLLKRRQR